MRRTLTTVATALLASAALVGCGGDQGSPEDTAYAFAEATVDLDGKGMCSLMLDEDDKPLKDDKKALKQCTDMIELIAGMSEDSDEVDMEKAKKEFEDLDKGDLKSKVDGDTAKVTMKGETDEISLKKVDGKWYIDEDMGL